MNYTPSNPKEYYTNKLKNKTCKNYETNCDKCVLAFDLFCNCTSVRGMGKLCRGPKLLRLMWLIFVLSMTCLLISSTALLIKDYLNYDINVHTQLILDDASPFPALTICHQPPFSTKAYELWNRSEILSPTKYNLYMRQLILNALKQNDVEYANAIWSYDSLSVYYQNLQYNESDLLGHTVGIYLNCMRYYTHMQTFEDNCTLLNGYRIRKLSHHQYLNCYTFEPINSYEANQTTILSIIVSMGPKDKNIEIQQAFLPDVFEQARGLRVVIHEAGTMPDLEKNGIHVESGKLNEINYQPIKWYKLNTPNKPCIKPNLTHQYLDMNELYNYTHTQCLLLNQQLEIMKNCHCVYAILPRPIIPNLNLPYCGKLWPQFNITDFSEKIKCLGMYLNNNVKQKFDGSICFPRCEFYEYETTTSITKWRIYPWQLYWLRVQNQASQLLQTYQSMYPDKNITETKAYKMWEYYLNYENLTDLPYFITDQDNNINNGHRDDNNTNNSNNLTEIQSLLPKWSSKYLDLDNDDFAYVILKRKSQNTIEKHEKLVLSSYVLISRIGGFCSLTIGLTAACFVELLEFIYLFYKKLKFNKNILDQSNQLINNNNNNNNNDNNDNNNRTNFEFIVDNLKVSQQLDEKDIE